jgi:hypothetical protein
VECCSLDANTPKRGSSATSWRSPRFSPGPRTGPAALWIREKKYTEHFEE